MTKNPFLNALLALGYITLVATLINATSNVKIDNNPFFGPIAFLSLFSFSAATMGYLFLYHPFTLYFDGQKKAGLDLFLKTLLTFGAITFLIFILFFARVIR